MWQPIVNIFIGTIIPGILAGLSGLIIVFVIALARKGYKYLVKKWDLDITERENYLIDDAVSNAVRAVEERANNSNIPSRVKEDMAVEIAKQTIKSEIPENNLRNRIKSTVNMLFHKQ